jgi:hypothetical protein
MRNRTLLFSVEFSFNRALNRLLMSVLDDTQDMRYCYFGRLTVYGFAQIAHQQQACLGEQFENCGELLSVILARLSTHTDECHIYRHTDILTVDWYVET